ncbi:MAG: 30S ribosomal protein S6 [Candidatus Aminicenantes bacterium 4484_214]|nr:MAG: 30S ribosomal protein S6 [Candidatus Aminicenantes bacterium 4484_214]RLE09029.1 MAG: 30S ribosomal protein S6 [Candidatus Aminicenantes bacterium]
MRLYETAFLIAPNLPEEEMDTLIQAMADVVKAKNGRLIREDRWGKRKLAYPIKKFGEAYYVFLLYEGNPDIPAELERQFKQKDAVIRFLTIKQDQRENVRWPKKTKAIPVTPLVEEGEEKAEAPVASSSEKKKEENNE